MTENLARQLIAEHLIEGEMRPDAEIALKIRPECGARPQSDRNLLRHA